MLLTASSDTEKREVTEVLDCLQFFVRNLKYLSMAMLNEIMEVVTTLPGMFESMNRTENVNYLCRTIQQNIQKI